MRDDTITTRAAPTKLQALLRLLRPKQWVKNAFVFAPLLFAGKLLHLPSVGQAVMAFILFSLAASAVYIINDWRDVEKDRQHPVKRHRPLAAGIITTKEAFTLLGILLAVLLLGAITMPQVGLVLAIYLALNIAYTFHLKRQPVVDIFTIAIGFVLRVYVGAVAIAVPLSDWMFITTLCLALYLAAIKRRQELLQSGAETRAVLGKYSIPLVERYAQMAATGALVFYSLFVMSAQPELVMTIPLVLFGLFRYWYVVEILQGGESPTEALFADWQLLLTVMAWVGLSAWGILSQ